MWVMVVVVVVTTTVVHTGVLSCMSNIGIGLFPAAAAELAPGFKWVLLRPLGEGMEQCRSIADNQWFCAHSRRPGVMFGHIYSAVRTNERPTPPRHRSWRLEKLHHNVSHELTINHVDGRHLPGGRGVLQYDQMYIGFVYKRI